MAVGIVVPLVVGWASGHSAYGAYAALGAFTAGFPAFEGVTRSRVAAVFAATVGMAVSTFVGGAVAWWQPWLLVPVAIIWAGVTGISVCLGQRASVAVLGWPLALLVAAGLPLAPGTAALRAVMVFAGGAFQAVLVVGSWLVRPGAGERAALAERFAALTRDAGDVAAGGWRPPAPQRFAAEDALLDPNPLLSSPTHLILVDLLEQAERVGASLAALAAQTTQGADAQNIRSFVVEVSAILRLIADALADPRGPRAASVDSIGAGVTGLAVPAGSAWRWAGEALLGQLRAITRSLSRLEDRPAATLAGQRARRPLALKPRSRDWLLGTLRANLDLASETGRHALRLAAIVGIGEILIRATGLQEGTWVPLTIFLVLRPDYTSTVDLGLQRSVGTLLGCSLGVAAAQLGHLGPGGLIAAAGLSTAAAYATRFVSYLLYSVFLTTFVVVMFDIAGHPAAPTAVARLIATAIGSVLAIAAYIAWPTWERLTAREKFARLLEAHRDYVRALLQALDGRSPDLPRLRSLQAMARLARGEAEASAARLEGEAQDRPFTAAMARSVIAPVNRLASAELALHALVTSSAHHDQALAGGDHHRVIDERVTALADAVTNAMSRLATSLRTRRPPPQLPPLRPLQEVLQQPPRPVDASLAATTDAMIDAIDSLESALRRCVSTDADEPDVDSRAASTTRLRSMSAPVRD